MQRRSEKSKLDGKIVLIERGLCDFSEKTFYAQKAGAKAVIICGFDEQNVGMAAGVDMDMEFPTDSPEDLPRPIA
ncbi:MAG: hypothetical protein IPO72_16310 [Saprospiraceae bacterium]|nr:hypothetical protein [Candidatus Vicinibacter affinis]